MDAYTLLGEVLAEVRQESRRLMIADCVRVFPT